MRAAAITIGHGGGRYLTCQVPALKYDSGRYLTCQVRDLKLHASGRYLM